MHGTRGCCGGVPINLNVCTVRPSKEFCRWKPVFKRPSERARVRPLLVTERRTLMSCAVVPAHGVNPLVPQVQKGKEGTKAGKGQDEIAEKLNEAFSCAEQSELWGCRLERLEGLEGRVVALGFPAGWRVRGARPGRATCGRRGTGELGRSRGCRVRQQVAVALGPRCPSQRSPPPPPHPHTLCPC
eukprot:362057-Chlamydomonas_euryale.AAC.1